MFSKKPLPIVSTQQRVSTSAATRPAPPLKPAILSALQSFTGQLIEELTNPVTIFRLDELKAQLSKNITTNINLFYQLQPSNFTLGFYLERLCRYLNLLPADLLHINIYLLRYLAKNPNDFLNDLNINRLLLTATLAYLKYMDYDDQGKLHKGINAYVAEVGGLSLAELNMLEVDFLKIINFDLYVECDFSTLSDEQILAYLNDIEILHLLAFPIVTGGRSTYKLVDTQLPSSAWMQFSFFPAAPQASTSVTTMDLSETPIAATTTSP